MSDKEENNDVLRTVYTAIVDYHNNLVQIRFTTVGLVLAANGFFATGYFESNEPGLPRFIIPFLGIIVIIIVCLLELRTYLLLKNLGKRGELIEQKLGISPSYGFFSLMRKQPIGPETTFLFLRRFRLNRKAISIISHNRGIGLLYALLEIFWILVIILSK